MELLKFYLPILTNLLFKCTTSGSLYIYIYIYNIYLILNTFSIIRVYFLFYLFIEMNIYIYIYKFILFYYIYFFLLYSIINNKHFYLASPLTFKGNNTFFFAITPLFFIYLSTNNVHKIRWDKILSF